MKKHLSYFLSFCVLLVLGACSESDPFLKSEQPNISIFYLGNRLNDLTILTEAGGEVGVEIMLQSPGSKMTSFCLTNAGGPLPLSFSLPNCVLQNELQGYGGVLSNTTKFCKLPLQITVPDAVGTYFIDMGLNAEDGTSITITLRLEVSAGSAIGPKLKLYDPMLGVSFEKDTLSALFTEWLDLGIYAQSDLGLEIVNVYASNAWEGEWLYESFNTSYFTEGGTVFDYSTFGFSPSYDILYIRLEAYDLEGNYSEKIIPFHTKYGYTNNGLIVSTSLSTTPAYDLVDNMQISFTASGVDMYEQTVPIFDGSWESYTGTMFVKAPVDFNYHTASIEETIRAYYMSEPVSYVDIPQVGDVYLAELRYSGNFALIRVTSIVLGEELRFEYKKYTSSW